jgi:Ser/Thr protein kinase RdoA (MazF antagonist)
MRRPKDYPVEALWQAFVEGYSSRNSLKDIDLAPVPEFVAIRQIWLMGLHATIVKTRGSGFMNDAYFDREMKILRDWQASELPE